MCPRLKNQRELVERPGKICMRGLAGCPSNVGVSGLHSRRAYTHETHEGAAAAEGPGKGRRPYRGARSGRTSPR